MSQEAFERALEALAQRERTSAELAAWLAERGFAPAEVEDAVGRLIEAGELDDERFAAALRRRQARAARLGAGADPRGAARARASRRR